MIWIYEVFQHNLTKCFFSFNNGKIGELKNTSRPQSGKISTSPKDRICDEKDEQDIQKGNNNCDVFKDSSVTLRSTRSTGNMYNVRR